MFRMNKFIPGYLYIERESGGESKRSNEFVMASELCSPAPYHIISLWALCSAVYL